MVMSPFVMACQNRLPSTAGRILQEVKFDAGVVRLLLAHDRQPEAQQGVDEARLGDLQPIPGRRVAGWERSGMTWVKRQARHRVSGSPCDNSPIAHVLPVIVGAQPVCLLLTARSLVPPAAHPGPAGPAAIRFRSGSRRARARNSDSGCFRKKTGADSECSGKFSRISRLRAILKA